MKKYRKKQEVYVWEWTGDKSLINEISDFLKPFNDYSIKLSEDESILCVISSCRHQKEGISTWTSYVRIGEYVIIDLTDNHFSGISKEYLDVKYVEINNT